MDFLSHPRRTRNPGYIHGMNANLAETLEAYARGIIRGIHPIDSDQSEAVLRALNNWGWDDDLKLYLPFDETSGQSAFDLSGNGNTGTATGTTIVDGVFGKARYFDYVDDGVNCGAGASLDITSALTLEAWVYSTLAGAYQHVIGKRVDNTDVQYGLMKGNNNEMLFEYQNVGWAGVYSTGYTIPLNAWAHVAATVSGTAYVLYRNGLSVGSGSLASGLTSLPAQPVYIGMYIPGEELWKGNIDEPRIYSRALSADEMYLHYLAGALKLGLI